MRKRVYAGMTLAALFSGQALANEKLTLVLDWYINPDHAPIVVAEQIGAFKEAGLDVKIAAVRPGAAAALSRCTPGGPGDYLPASGAFFC
jgi:ABC-type nitrate/sulfonate/bicarbonate transport system substrate-binding protein